VKQSTVSPDKEAADRDHDPAFADASSEKPGILPIPAQTHDKPRWTKQIGIAIHNFHEVHGHLPASGAGEPPVSWRIHALPYLDNPDLFETYDQTLAWNSDKNKVIAKQRIEQLTCPSTQTTKDTLDRWYTHYAMVSGQKTIGDRQNPRSFSDFTDGTSNTIAVVEAAGLNIVWTEPRDSEVSDNNLGINLTGPTPTESPALISAWHRGGGHVLMADGAVKLLRHNIDPAVLKALTTVDGNDSIEGWDAW
jgi:prepilin-type processing-associated H-X9-DG protein